MLGALKLERARWDVPTPFVYETDAAGNHTTRAREPHEYPENDPEAFRKGAAQFRAWAAHMTALAEYCEFREAALLAEQNKS